MGEAIIGASVATAIILAVAAAMIVAMKIVNQVQDGRVAAWSDAARAFGLRFEDAPPDPDGMLTVIDKRITGALMGCALTVQITNGQFDNSTLATRGELVLQHPLPSELRIERKGLLNTTRSNVETGDADFDALFTVRAARPEQALRVLTSPVRSALVELCGVVSGVVLTQDKLTWREFSGLYDRDRLKAVLAAMKRLAEALHASTQGLAEARGEMFAGVTMPERAEVEVEVAASAPARAARGR